MRTEDAKNHCYKLADHLRDLDSNSRDAAAIETLLGALMPQKTLRERLIDIFHYAMTDSLKGIEGTTAFYTAGKFREGIAAGIDALIRDGFLTMSAPDLSRLRRISDMSQNGRTAYNTERLSCIIFDFLAGKLQTDECWKLAEKLVYVEFLPAPPTVTPQVKE